MDTYSTTTLLDRARRGDEWARGELFKRFLPLLQRWAHGRLPGRARGLVDTEDIVHVTLLKALNHLQSFEPRHEGAFFAYLRQILLNEIRQELRRAARRPMGAETPGGQVAHQLSPLEQLLGEEFLESYEAGLSKLSETERAAVILRLEFGFSHAGVAESIGSPSANAARMTVKRAILKLAEAMEHEKPRE